MFTEAGVLHKGLTRHTVLGGKEPGRGKEKAF